MRKGDEMKKILKSTQSIICSFMVMCLMCSRAPMQVRAEETSVSASDVQAEEISVSVSDVQAEETSVSASDAQVYQVTENVYYVDAVNGNDENDGHSIGTAWKTLEKVNSHTFEAGERTAVAQGKRHGGKSHQDRQLRRRGKACDQRCRCLKCRLSGKSGILGDR